MDQRANQVFLKNFLTQQKEFKEVRFFLVLLMVISPLLGLRLKLGWFSLIVPALVFSFFILSQLPSFKINSKFFTPSDFFSLIYLGFIPLLFQKIKFIQPQIPLTLILICLFYGGSRNKLGREKFSYHYTFNYSYFFEFLKTSVIGLSLIFVLSLLTGFIKLQDFDTKDLAPLLLFKNINIWFYYVGIAEEIIFKIILLNFIADLFRWKSFNHPKTIALFLSAFIFGLAHAVKGWDYAFLAFLSSCFTGHFYLKYKGVLSPIFFHMILDIIAISLFKAKL